MTGLGAPTTATASGVGPRTYGNWRKPSSPGLPRLGLLGTAAALASLVLVMIVQIAAGLLAAGVAALLVALAVAAVLEGRRLYTGRAELQAVVSVDPVRTAELAEVIAAAPDRLGEILSDDQACAVIGEARAAAAAWVSEHAITPRLVGAFVTGSTLGAQPDDELAPDSDVDLIVVVSGPPPAKLGKLTYRGVRLDVDVGTGDVLEERRLSNVGVSANEESAGVGVDRGQTAQMLPDLVEVEKRVLQTLADGGHATKSSALELLALEQTLTILDETHVISGDGLDQTLCGVTLAEGNAEVVGVVESVEQILVERVNVGEAREAVQDSRQLLTEGLCGVFDLAHVEGPNTSDLETRANLGGQTALGARQHNVQELLRGRHGRDVLPCCLHLCGVCCVSGNTVWEGKARRRVESRTMHWWDEGASLAEIGSFDVYVDLVLVPPPFSRSVRISKMFWCKL